MFLHNVGNLLFMCTNLLYWHFDSEYAHVLRHPWHASYIMFWQLAYSLHLTTECYDRCVSFFGSFSMSTNMFNKVNSGYERKVWHSQKGEKSRVLMGAGGSQSQLRVCASVEFYWEYGQLKISLSLSYILYIYILSTPYNNNNTFSH